VHRRRPAGRQAEGSQAGGIEPDADGVFAAAENDDIAHAVEPQKLLADPQVHVVGDIQLVVALIGRQQMHHHEEVAGLLGRGDALAAHFFRQTRLGDGDAVLHLHLRSIQIGARPEGDGQLHLAV